MWPIPNNGASVVYKKILRPFLLKNEEKIDARLENVTGKVNKYVDDAKREGEAKIVHCLHFLHPLPLGSEGPK